MKLNIMISWCFCKQSFHLSHLHLKILIITTERVLSDIFNRKNFKHIFSERSKDLSAFKNYSIVYLTWDHNDSQHAMTEKSEPFCNTVYASFWSWQEITESLQRDKEENAWSSDWHMMLSSKCIMKTLSAFYKFNSESWLWQQSTSISLILCTLRILSCI